MKQNGKMGSTTPTQEHDMTTSVDLPQAGTELAVVNTELAESKRNELEASLKKSTGLSLAQVIALEAISQGQSVVQAAQMAKVNPGSIYRWMSKDPAFIEHHEIVKRDRLNAVRVRLSALTDRAIDAVERQIGFGDGRLGLEFLREMKVTPKSCDEPRSERSETVVEMVQKRLSVPTTKSDTKSDREDENDQA